MECEWHIPCWPIFVFVLFLNYFDYLHSATIRTAYLQRSTNIICLFLFRCKNGQTGSRPFYMTRIFDCRTHTHVEKLPSPLNICRVYDDVNFPVFVRNNVFGFGGCEMLPTWQAGRGPTQLQSCILFGCIMRRSRPKCHQNQKGNAYAQLSSAALSNNW